VIRLLWVLVAVRAVLFASAQFVSATVACETNAVSNPMYASRGSCLVLLASTPALVPPSMSVGRELEGQQV
jgi:hypothetical protein